MTMTQRLVMHARLQGGALYSYNIMDGDVIVGSKSTKLDKKKRTQTSTYFLGDAEFTCAAEFIAAYERKKLAASRDAEWESAAPNRKNQK